MGRRFVRSESAMGEVVDGELVLLNVESGDYFGLNRTGTRVWELLGEGVDLDQVEEKLLVQYPVDRKILQKDVRELVVALQEAGLIREVSGG